MGQGGTNMDIKLGLRHLMKDMQDLLHIIRGSVRLKKGNSNDTLFLCKVEVEGQVMGLTSIGCMVA